MMGIRHVQSEYGTESNANQKKHMLGIGRKNSEHSDDAQGLNFDGLDDFDDEEDEGAMTGQNPFGGKKARKFEQDDEDRDDEDADAQNEFWASRVRKNAPGGGTRSGQSSGLNSTGTGRFGAARFE